MKNRIVLFIIGVSLILFSAFTFNTLRDVANANYKLRGVFVAPQIISPINGTVVDSVCQLSWTKINRNPSYYVQVSNTADFDYVQEYFTSDTTITINLGTPTFDNKYIRLKAYKNKRKRSAWSNTITVVHGASQQQIEVIQFGGCSGNCGSCPNPCGGRRPKPDLYNE